MSRTPRYLTLVQAEEVPRARHPAFDALLQIVLGLLLVAVGMVLTFLVMTW